LICAAKDGGFVAGQGRHGLVGRGWAWRGKAGQARQGAADHGMEGHGNARQAWNI